MTMQTKRKFTARKWLAAMLCLAIALMTTHLTVWAVDLTQSNYLTVTTAEDLDGAKVLVDVYQLAEATPVEGYDTYGYQFLGNYNNITIGDSRIGDEELAAGLKNGTVSISNDQWNSIAQQASQMAKDGAAPVTNTYDFGTQLNLSSGVYLIVARGSGLEEYWDSVEEDGETKIVTYAESDKYKFSFTPAIISLPTKNALTDDSGNQTIGTAAEYGDWIYDSSMYMKAEIEPLYGSIQITKQIDQFNGDEELTFVFEITADGEFERGEAYHYSTVASVAFNQANGTTATVTVDHIRAGAVVQVREVYDGLRYHAESMDWQGPETVTADSDGATPVTFTFTNYFDNDKSGGHGIQNHFVFGRLPGETQDHWINTQQTAGSGLYN